MSAYSTGLCVSSAKTLILAIRMLMPFRLVQVLSASGGRWEHRRKARSVLSKNWIYLRIMTRLSHRDGFPFAVSFAEGVTINGTNKVVREMLVLRFYMVSV